MLNWSQLEKFLDGALVTVEIWALSVVVGTVLALLFGFLSRAQSRLLRILAAVYVEFFRGVSAIILLFWVFFAVPIFFEGLLLSPLISGTIALGANMGAYGAEIVRLGIGAVPRGQIDAATSVGLSGWQTRRYIIFPQAAVTMIPPYGNLLIELLKGTSLVSLITLSDLLFEAQKLRTGRAVLVDPPSSFVIFGTVLVMYFVMAQVLAMGVRLVERRAGRGLSFGHHATRVRI